MPRRLIYAPLARHDFEIAKRWLRQPGSGPAAWRRLAVIRNDIMRLVQQPCLWPVGRHHGVRELPTAGGYRVLYDVTPDTGSNATAGDIRVLRIYGPGQSRRGP